MGRARPACSGCNQGIPLTSRTSQYAGVLPDRITIYRQAICAICRTEPEVAGEVRRTVIHEIAHTSALTTTGSANSAGKTPVSPAQTRASAADRASCQVACVAASGADGVGAVRRSRAPCEARHRTPFPRPTVGETDGAVKSQACGLAVTSSRSAPRARRASAMRVMRAAAIPRLIYPGSTNRSSSSMAPGGLDPGGEADQRASLFHDMSAAFV